MIWPNERFQTVAVGEEFSSWARIESGFPQGTKLSPWAFKLFLNDLLWDLDKYKEDAMISCFADDMKILLKKLKNLNWMKILL